MQPVLAPMLDPYDRQLLLRFLLIIAFAP